MILFMISLTTLSSGFCSESALGSSWRTWHDAQTLCKKNNTVLTNVLYNASSADEYYWTGYHVRMSQWIKIIGCFPYPDVNGTGLLKGSIEMQFPSAGLCQEVCLKFNSSVFGVKSKKCVCLRDVHQQRIVPSDQCNFKCENEYSNETSIKFSKECGGENTYNVFKSGSDEKIPVLPNVDCLSIQCAQSSKIFVKIGCSETIARICNTSVNKTAQSSWQISSELCKSNHHAYLYGDVNLTDVISACQRIEGQVTGPAWLGIAKEKYISFHEVEDHISKIQGSPVSIRCLKCSSLNCMFDNCDAPNNFECMERPSTTTQTSTGSSYTTTNLPNIFSAHHSSISSTTIFGTTKGAPTEHNRTQNMMTIDNDSVPITVIVIPLAAIITIGSVILLLVILWRRRIKMTSKAKPDRHKPDSLKYSEKCNVDQSLQNNYFQLEKRKSDSIMDFSNHTKPKDTECPYNESSDGDYDHLGENIRKKVEENAYHHAFFSINEEESDYGVKDTNDDCLMENPYNHMNANYSQVNMPDNEYNTISSVHNEC